jgi:hypothetical protein
MATNYKQVTLNKATLFLMVYSIASSKAGSPQCLLVLPFPISSILSTLGHAVAAYAFFVCFPSFISFPLDFLQ